MNKKGQVAGKDDPTLVLGSVAFTLLIGVIIFISVAAVLTQTTLGAFFDLSQQSSFFAVFFGTIASLLLAVFIFMGVMKLLQFAS